MFLRTIRIALAAVFFALLTLLLLDFSGTLHPWLGWMAKVQFLPALLALNVGVVAVLVLLTLVFGRIYCSVVCPLGVMQDIFGWLGRRKKKNRYAYSPEKRALRYGVLALTVVCWALGVGAVVQLLAPYSAFGRIITALLQPLWLWANNGLAAIAEHYHSYAFYSVEVWMRSLSLIIVAAVTLVLLAVLAWRGGRSWCNTICPVGTVLSFLARFSWLKVRIDTEKCVGCSLCEKRCKAACIDSKHHRVDYSRCVACGDCVKACHSGAISYAPSAKKAAAPDPSKRSFLVASALLATAAMAQEKKKVDGGLAAITGKQAPERHTPITPPGSLSAWHMAKHCTGCQLCVTKCPNHVLRPSAGLLTLMQPVMSFERGYCRPECTLCSEVCPAGAIHPIDKVEKTSIQIGLAVVNTKMCLPATGGDACGSCARHCPSGAIHMVRLRPDDANSPRIPSVDETRCIGCGKCEYLCPVRPLSAIRVEGKSTHSRI